MVNVENARAIFLDHYGRLLNASQPYGNVILPGHETSHLMHVTDLVWIKHIFDDLQLTDVQRDAWAARINRDQEPDTGLFRYPAGTSHIDEHATWQCVAALNLLGREPARRLACVAPLLDVQRFRNWCNAYDPATSHHRFMLAVIAAASGSPSAEWRAVYCDWYDAQQDPQTGFPFDASAPRSLSRAFLLTTMRAALGGPVPRADQIIQTVLAFQNRSGGVTDADLPGYLEMDAAFLLHRLSQGTETHTEQINAFLERAGQLLTQTLADVDRRARLLDDPHRALAVCGNLSVIWQHIARHGDRPLPFPWAELEHFRAPI
jgi:hypothetical protein